MGLYDNRLAELSDRSRGRRVAQRRPFAPSRTVAPPYARPAPRPARPFAPPPPLARPSPRPAPAAAPAVSEAARKRPAMDIQTLLFSRDAGWTAERAKQWAKSHGYKHGKVDVTDQYIRLRQFDPKGLKVKRTITLGKGIRAVVAREEGKGTMAAKRRRTKEEARRPRRRRAATRRTREAAPVAAEARRPRRRRAAKRTTRAREAWKSDKAGHRKAAKKGWAKRRRRSTREAPVSEARRRPRRRPRRAPVHHGQMMEARRPARRRPRRRRASEAWKSDKAGHRKAAKKGWAKRRRSGKTTTRRRRTREFAYEEARRPRRRARRSRESTMMEARRPRRRSRRTRAYEAAPRRRSYRARARGGAGGGRGMFVAELATAIVAGGVGFVLADVVDRFLSTYDPAAVAAGGTAPTDKFTSDGAGTLANTLNVASMPSWQRWAAAVGITAVPAVGSVFVDQPFVKSGLEGMAVGAGVKLFTLLWNNVVMPMLKPAATDNATIQKSMIARLYPAEVAAAMNRAQTPPQTAAQGVAFGSLSGQQPGVGAPPADVGPFALAAESPYPDAAQALRRQAGMSGAWPGPGATPGQNYPTFQQSVWGTGMQSTPGVPPGVAAADFPTVAQTMGVGQAFSDIANTVQAMVPGTTPQQAMQAAAHVATEPFNLVAALARALPHIQTAILHECARYVHPHVVRLHASAPAGAPTPTPPPAAGPPGPAPAPGVSGFTGLSQAPTPPAPPPPPAPAPAAAAPAPAPAPAPATVPSGATPTPPALPVVPSPMPGPQPTSGHWHAGPPALPHPGPQPPDTSCGCIGDDNPFLGFIGDAEEKDALFVIPGRAA